MTVCVSEALGALGLRDEAALSDAERRAVWLRRFLRAHGWLVGYSRDGPLLYVVGSGSVSAIVRALGLCSAELRSYFVEQAAVPPVDGELCADAALTLSEINTLIARVHSELDAVRCTEGVEWVEFRSRFLFKQGYARGEPSWLLLGVACHELIQWRAARR